MTHSSHVAIVGQGCIGSIIASYLDSPDSIIITRIAFPNTTRISINQIIKPVPGRCLTIKEVDFRQIGLVVVPIKSYQNEILITQLQSVIMEHTSLLIVQNGIQFIPQYLQAFPKNPILAGLSTDGAFRNKSGIIEFVGEGEFRIGSIQLANKSNVDPILKTHPRAFWIDNVHLAIYQKLLINIAINPLTFIHGCKNGQLFHRLADVNRLIDEVIHLFTKMQLAFDPNAWRESVFSVIEATASNQSSMLQDKLHSRKTEIDAIVGATLTLARQFNYSPSFLTQVFTQVKREEQNYLSPNT